MKRSLKLPLAMLAAVPFVMVLGNSMLIPVFPKMRQVMHLSAFQVGLIITAFSVPAGVLIPFAGALSDRIGRRPVMAPALILYGLGGLLAGASATLFAQPYGWIMAGRVLQGIGAGGTYQLAMALTGDLVGGGRERTSALGLLEAANGLGKVVSPILGALIAGIVWFAPFFAYGLLALPVAAAVWFLVPEGAQRNKQSLREYTRALGRVFRTRGVSLAGAYAAGMAGLFLLFGLLSFLSDFLEDRYQITGLTKGFVLAGPVGAMAIASYLTGLFIPQGWLKPAILGGLAITTAALAAVPFLLQLVPFVLVTAAVGLGIGLMLPPLNTLITGATASDERGLVTCLYGTVRFFGVALGPPVFGLVQGMGILRSFWGAAAISALALVLAAWMIQPQTMHPEKPGKKPRRPKRTDREARRTDQAAPNAVVWEPEVETPGDRCPLDP